MLPGPRPRFSWLFRSDIVGLGVSHLLPGGAATSGALRYRLLQQGGAPGDEAAVGIAVEGAASTLMLAALFWLALIVSIPVLGLHRGYVIAALIGAVLLAGILLALGPALAPTSAVRRAAACPDRPAARPGPAAYPASGVERRGPAEPAAGRPADADLIGVVGGRELGLQRRLVGFGTPAPSRCWPSSPGGCSNSGRRYRSAASATSPCACNAGGPPHHGVHVQSRTSGMSSKFART
jgi:hypothetical protein